MVIVLSWTCKGLSNQSIKLRTTSNNILPPELDYYDNPKIKLSFDMSCLLRDKVTFNHGKIVNIYIVYEEISIASINGNRDSNLTIEKALFGAVSLTKNADVDKYRYSRYGIAFDRKGGGGYDQNVIIFGADMNSSPHTDTKGKDILILGTDPTQGLGEHSLTAEKMCSINFTKEYTKFCLSLHYNGANSYLFVNGREIIKFKEKDSNIVAKAIMFGKYF